MCVVSWTATADDGDMAFFTNSPNGGSHSHPSPRSLLWTVASILPWGETPSGQALDDLPLPGGYRRH